jgi:hypothetical protein
LKLANALIIPYGTGMFVIFDPSPYIVPPDIVVPEIIVADILTNELEFAVTVVAEIVLAVIPALNVCPTLKLLSTFVKAILLYWLAFK